MSPAPSAAATEALETRARQIAADKMGLIKDPTGAKLPEDLWWQALPQAQAELAADSPYVTTRLAKAADRAAKAEARGEGLRAALDHADERAITAEVQVGELTTRAEKAEHLLEMEQSSREAWRKEAQWAHDLVAAAEAQVGELTRKLDDTRVDLAFANEELFFLRAGAKDDADKIADLTHKLNEARNVLREVEWRDGYCSSCRQRWSQFNIENKHKPGCRLAAVIAPETGKETL